MHVMLYAGEPIGEPVVARGPFVMNTEEEILQAFADYRNGNFLDDQGIQYKYKNVESWVSVLK